MDFTEEHSPSKNIFKILLNKFQFLVFDSKGSSVYADEEGRSMVHTVPTFVFIGQYFRLIKEYEKPYVMLKIRNGSIILPYRDLRDRTTKFLFIETDKKMEMIPARLFHYRNVALMVKEFDMSIKPDYAVIDDVMRTNDLFIVKNRFKIGTAINADMNNNQSIQMSRKKLEKKRRANINMLSENPVFLTTIHLKSKDFSLINQLLLDFDLSVLDTEYILFLIQRHIDVIEKTGDDEKHLPMVKSLHSAFTFYQYLLNRDGEHSKSAIDEQSDIKELAPMRTLIQKAKSMHPNKEEQIFYNEIEEFLLEKRSSL